METCGILVPFSGSDCAEDNDGCLKREAHNDAHISRLIDGSIIEWEDDYSCTCGCWDEWEAGDSDVCRIYRFITVEQAIEKIGEKYNGTIPEEIIGIINQI